MTFFNAAVVVHKWLQPLFDEFAWISLALFIGESKIRKKLKVIFIKQNKNLLDGFHETSWANWGRCILDVLEHSAALHQHSIVIIGFYIY